jgi:hypothetical protein
MLDFEFSNTDRIVFLPFLFSLMKKETKKSRLLRKFLKSTTSPGCPTGNSSFIQKCASALFYHGRKYVDIFEFSRQTPGWSAPCDVGISTNFLKGQRHRPTGLYRIHSFALSLSALNSYIFLASQRNHNKPIPTS